MNPSVLGGLVVDFGEKTIDLTISSRVNKLNNLLQGSVFIFIHSVLISRFASDRIRLKDCNLGLVRRLDQNIHCISVANFACGVKCSILGQLRYVT